VEQKLKRLGSYFRWLGIVVFLAGVLLTLFEVSGGIVVITLGILSALQGSIIEFIFK
jgi:hypothetical protein